MKTSMYQKPTHERSLQAYLDWVNRSSETVLILYFILIVHLYFHAEILIKPKELHRMATLPHVGKTPIVFTQFQES